MNAEIAKNAAILFVHTKYEPLKTRSGFAHYYIRVGTDPDRIDTPIFADLLPVHELTLLSDSDAIKAFSEHCDCDKEFLVKVWLDFKIDKYDAKILWGN